MTVFAGVLVAAGVLPVVEDVAVPTYMFSDPDPVPRTSAPYYPYFRFDGYATQATPKTWKRVVLDNGRVRVELRPEIGGRVWGAKDLASGHDYIYHNHVVKFRDLSMIGPYASGGIEFNFGIMGHAAYVTQPVDWCVRTNADGSASFFSGCHERITRQFWQVEVRLVPGERAFRTHSTWYNGAGLPGPCYHWMNAGFPGGAQTKYLHPAANWVGHGGEVHPWPIERGHDIRVYDRNNLPGECSDSRWDHVPGRIEDHRAEHLVNGDNRIYGVWWPHRKIGAYHYNPTDEMLGRKIWMWALSRQGDFWHTLLTDRDGPYVELQCGRVFQQPGYDYRHSPFKFPSFAAGRTDVADEIWGVLESPDEFERKFAPRREPIDRPLVCPKDMNWQGAWGRYLMAVQLLNARTDDAGAEKGLQEALALEPCLSPALDALAILYARQGRDDEARACARKAMAVDTYDPAANYCEGVILAAEGKRTAALERFAVASSDRNWRSAALVASARIRLAEGDFAEALQLARKALESNARDLYAILAEAIALRKTGRKDAARNRMEAMLVQVPLFHAFAFECAKAGGAPDWRRNLHGAYAADDLVEMALWYDGAGLTEEAREICAASASPLARIVEGCVAPSGAAGCRTYVGVEGCVAPSGAAGCRTYVGEASCLPAPETIDLAFVFPTRRELLPALEKAARTSTSWKYKYLLALFRAANGRGDLAERLLADCGDEPDDPTFYIYRATRLKGEPARRDLKRASGLGDSWRVGMALYQSYADEGNWAKAAEATAEYLKRFPGNDFLELNHARALLKAGEPEKTVAFLDAVEMIPSELGEKPATMYTDANVEIARRALERGDRAAARKALAKATSYPDRLGAGRPYRLDRLIELWPGSVRDFWKSGEASFVQEGDRVLFFGDSITQWSGVVSLVREHWRRHHPNSGTQFLNGGRGGEKSSGGAKRVGLEVDRQKPTKAIVMFGMNDTSDTGDAMVARYRESMKAIVDEFRARKIPVLLLTPTPYDEYTSFAKEKADVGRNEIRMTRLAAVVRELGAAEDVPVIELHRPLTALLKSHPETQYVRDRMHPSSRPGSEVLAEVLLQGLGEDPVDLRLTPRGTSRATD